MSGALGTLDYPQVDTTPDNPLQAYHDQLHHLSGFVGGLDMPTITPPPQPPAANDQGPLQSVAQPPTLAEGWSSNANQLADYVAHQRAEAAAAGLWNPETGLPTAKGIVEAGKQTAMGVVMGTTAPGEVPAPGLMRELTITPKAGENPVTVPVRPASEDVHDTVQSSFKYGQDVGPTTVPMDSLKGGVDTAQPKEAARVADLQKQITGPDGYISRPIVDTDGNVIEGQHRVEALRQMGATNVPVHMVEDLSKGVDTNAMEASIKAAQPGMHPDQVQQLTQQALQAHAEEGSPQAVRDAYDAPQGYQKAWDAALTHLESEPQNALAKAATDVGQAPPQVGPAAVRGPVESTPGYVYHATNAERLQDIAEGGKLETHKPGDFTDQDVWPDGATGKRNYFTPNAEHTHQFAPEEGQPALLRMRQDAHPTKTERGTGDLYSTQPVDAQHLEYHGTDGGWHPVSALKSQPEAPQQNIFKRLLGDNKGGGPNPLQRFQGVSTLPGAARADEPAPLAPGEADRVSTRLPKAKTLDYDPHQTQDMRVDLDAARSHPDSYAKNVGLIREQPAMNVGRLKNPDSISDRFVGHLKDNILAIYDRMSGMDPDVVRRAQGWYDGANKIAGQMAEKYGYSKRQMAGVLASLSPQKDWFQNVDLARRLMDTVQRMGNRSATPEMKAWAKQWTENAEKDPEEPKASVEKFRGAVARNGNRPLSQITDNYDRAVWVRMYDEAHNLDRGYRVVTPEGGYGARATTNKGADQKITWGSFNEIAKAMNALKEDSTANISQSVGGAHKVRNFYNNIISPNAPHGDITVDTHAIAGALLRPLGGSTRSVAQGLGTGGNVSSPASTGIRGLYAHYAEAYRQAAEERGVLPRQMQSVTWEGTRGLFSPEQRRDVKFVEMIDNIWRQHAKGTLDGPTARQQIFDAAGGINPPEWTAP